MAPSDHNGHRGRRHGHSEKSDAICGEKIFTKSRPPNFNDTNISSGQVAVASSGAEDDLASQLGYCVISGPDVHKTESQGSSSAESDSTVVTMSGSGYPVATTFPPWTAQLTDMNLKLHTRELNCQYSHAGVSVWATGVGCGDRLMVQEYYLDPSDMYSMMPSTSSRSKPSVSAGFVDCGEPTMDPSQSSVLFGTGWHLQEMSIDPSVFETHELNLDQV